MPEGRSILQVSGAQDEDPKAAEQAQGEAAPAKPTSPRSYADKEMPINVVNNNEGISLSLAPAVAPANPAAPASPPSR